MHNSAVELDRPSQRFCDRWGRWFSSIQRCYSSGLWIPASGWQRQT